METETRKRNLSHRSNERSGMLGFFYYFLVVLFILVVLYILLFSTFTKIENVYIKGLQELEYDDVKRVTEEIINEKIFGFIPKNNIVILSSEKIKKDLKRRYKKIGSVGVEKKFPDTVIIEIEERRAVLVWCEWNKCYVVDEKGVAYTEADFNSPEIVENKLITIRDESNKQVDIGDKVLNVDFVEFLVGIKEGLENNLNIKIKGEFKTPNSISGDFRVETEGGWKLYLNKELGFEKEIKMLEIILEKNIEEERLKDIDYIDLRTENKVYYKFKEEEKEEEADNESTKENSINP